ncbi:MAG TPA: amidase family protein [Acidimicrobiales bacterium]|nr:amidase family protein [Acidimicrobiales bacterium]
MTAWPPAHELADAVRSGARSARQVTEEALAAVEAGNGALGAFVVVAPDLARAAADAVDATVAAGQDPGPLAGVPIGVKDLEDCVGLPTSHGSRPFQGRPPVAVDSIHVARLRAAGAVPLGKTAAPEFGTLSWTRTKAWGTARNPWDTRLTPGGSSGGSAAAVAGGLVPLATASDGGGSTRSPAGFCGLVGHKASFGRIPDHRPTGSMTSVVGALATTVRDAARHLDVAAGPDPRDRSSLPAPGLSYEEAIDALDVAGLRARWSTDLGFAAVDPEVATVARAAADALAEAGGLVLDEEPVTLTDPVRTWLTGGALDMWLALEDDMWPAVADDLTLYSRRALEQTAELPIPRLVAPARRRAVLEREVAALFTEVDVLLTPTTAVPAFVAEGPPPAEIAGRAVHPAMATPFTMVANLCWNPSTSVPAGRTAAGLPVGLMVTTRHHRDDVALRLTRVLEQARPWPRTAADA